LILNKDGSFLQNSHNLLIFCFFDLFSNGKICGLRRWLTVDQGRWPWLWLTKGQLRWFSGQLNLAVVEGKWRGRCDDVDGMLTGAWAMARRRRTGGGASASSGDGVSLVGGQRRRTRGVRCFTGGRVAFYRVGTGVEAAGEAVDSWRRGGLKVED
jgi:hypothetical protein